MATVVGLFFTTLLICNFIQAIYAGLIGGNFKIILNNVTSEYDPEYAILEFKSYQDDKQNYFLHFYLNHLKELGSDNIFMLYQILMERNENEYIYIVNGKPVDLCKYFQKPKQDPLFNIYVIAINKHGNLIRSCPIHKMEFNVTLPMADIKLPSFTPPGKYKYILQLTKKIDDKLHQIYRGAANIKIVKI